MANQRQSTNSGRRTTSSNSSQKRGPGRPRKNPQAASPAPRQRQSRTTVQQTNNYSFADFYHDFSKKPVFFPVAVIIVTTVIVLFDLLLAWNNFQRFFIIVGIEVLIAAIIQMFRTVFNLSSESAEENE